MMKKHGFSLVEVLIALAILAVGIIAISKMLLDSQKSAILAQEQVIAGMIAQSCFSQLNVTVLDADGVWLQNSAAFAIDECKKSGRVEFVSLKADKRRDEPEYHVTLHLMTQSGHALDFTSVVVDKNFPNH